MAIKQKNKRDQNCISPFHAPASTLRGVHDVNEPILHHSQRSKSRHEVGLVLVLSLRKWYPSEAVAPAESSRSVQTRPAPRNYSPVLDRTVSLTTTPIPASHAHSRYKTQYGLDNGEMLVLIRYKWLRLSSTRFRSHCHNAVLPCWIHATNVHGEKYDSSTSSHALVQLQPENHHH